MSGQEAEPLRQGAIETPTAQAALLPQPWPIPRRQHQPPSQTQSHPHHLSRPSSRPAFRPAREASTQGWGQPRLPEACGQAQAQPPTLALGPCPSPPASPPGLEAVAWTWPHAQLTQKTACHPAGTGLSLAAALWPPYLLACFSLALPRPHFLGDMTWGGGQGDLGPGL